MCNVVKKIVLKMAVLQLLEDLTNGAIRCERAFRECKCNPVKHIKQ